MIMAGAVHARHVLLPVSFRLPTRLDITLEFVVDTGFTGELTLPPDAVTTMVLPFLYRMPAQLADGSLVEVAIYSAVIVWKGIDTEVRVLATGERPLLGTALLDGNELIVQFREEGLVTLDDL